MPKDFLFPLVPGVNSQIVLSSNASYNKAMLGALVDLNGFTLTIGPEPDASAFGAFQIAGPGNVAGALTMAVGATASISVVVSRSAFRFATGGGGGGYVHPTGDGNMHVPATGTTSNGKALIAGPTAGSMSWTALDKSMVGLSNVENTSDAAKPVSVATSVALNQKADWSGVARYDSAIVNFTGGISGRLDSIPTTGSPIGKLQLVNVGSSIYLYRLTAGTISGSQLPDWVRPIDYNPSTNARYWVLQSVSAPSVFASISLGTHQLEINGPNGVVFIRSDNIENDRSLQLPDCDGTIFASGMGSSGGNGYLDEGKPAVFGADGTMGLSDWLSIVGKTSDPVFSFVDMGGRNMTLYPEAMSANRIIKIPNADGILSLQESSANYNPQIVGLTGGGATQLNGIPTTGLPAGRIQIVFNGLMLAVYQLQSSSAAQSLPNIVRPGDYTVVSPKVWKLVGYLPMLSDGSNGASDAGLGMRFGPDGDGRVSDFFEIYQRSAAPALSLVCASGPSAVRRWTLVGGLLSADRVVFISDEGGTLAVKESSANYRSTITGLTGGGVTALDGIPTIGLPTGYLQIVFKGSSIAFYRLTASTATESSPDIVRPDDYGPANQRVWISMGLEANWINAEASIGSPYFIVRSPAGTGTFAGNELSDDWEYEVPNEGGRLALAQHVAPNLPVLALADYATAVDYNGSNQVISRWTMTSEGPSGGAVTPSNNLIRGFFGTKFAAGQAETRFILRDSTMLLPLTVCGTCRPMGAGSPNSRWRFRSYNVMASGSTVSLVFYDGGGIQRVLAALPWEPGQPVGFAFSGGVTVTRAALVHQGFASYSEVIGFSTTTNATPAGNCSFGSGQGGVAGDVEFGPVRWLYGLSTLEQLHGLARQAATGT